MPSHVILAVEAASLRSSTPSPMAAKLRNAGYDVLVSSNASEAVGLVFVNRRIETVFINSYGEPRIGVEVAARLRSLWQGHGQEESHGSQPGEFSCPSGKRDIVLVSGEDAMQD